MKTDQQILFFLTRCREAKKEINNYLKIINQIKQENYRKPLSQFDSNSYNKTTQCGTNESILDKENCKQITFSSGMEKDFDICDVRSFIDKYERMLVSRERDSHNTSETVEDIFKLSQSQQSNQYDTSNFGNDPRFIESKFNTQTTPFQQFYDKSIKESVQQIEQKIMTNDFSKKNDSKSFEQFYQEFMEEEVQNISQEIQDMQKFLQRVQTAKDKLSCSVKDLQQINVLNPQSSQESIERVNNDLAKIENLRNSMLIQMREEVTDSKIKELRNLKSRIQIHFNQVECELVKLNEEQLASV